MELTISAVWKTEKILEIKDELNTFLIQNSKNPFISAQSICDEMETPIEVKDGKAVTLVFRKQEKIVGVMPLLIRDTFKIRFAQLLFHYSYSSDLLFERESQSLCVQQACKFIFNRLRCQFLSLDLPSDSTALGTLEKSDIGKYILRIEDQKEMQHCVLPINCTWSEFESSKSTRFRNNLKSNERKLSKAGQWQISISENDDEYKTINKIMDVEESCWKEELRKSRQDKIDPTLLRDWKWSGIASKTFPGCKRRVWFLYLDDRVIAYNLAVEYKGTIYMCKTSFNNKYRHLYPGIFLNNTAIRDSFNFGSVRLIDFISNLPFQERWSRIRQSRVRILMAKGILPKLFTVASKRPQVKKVIQQVIPSELI